MKLLQAIQRFFTEYKSPRYRDRRAFYASDLTKDRRDIFWARTGVAETNPPDFQSKVRMLIGKAIETGLMQDVIQHLHWFGIHMVGSTKDQIPVGFSAPVAVDGYLDALLCTRSGDTYSKPFVLEIKTKNGYGATLFQKNPEPDDSYLAQMGTYLKDLSAKGVTSEGMFLYFLLSDETYGDMITINCKYDPATEIITATTGESIYGQSYVINKTLNVKKTLEAMLVVQKQIDAGTLPESQYQYKYPVTPEVAAQLSDYKLEKVLNGSLIIGDWQPRYSGYKDLHVKAQGGYEGYTPEEMQIFRAEWSVRKPRSKKFA